MSQPYMEKNTEKFKNDIDLLELFKILWQGKWTIFYLTAAFSIIGVLYSLYLPNIYKSKALLAPANSSSINSKISGSYSSLAGLAGIRVPTSDTEDNSMQAIEKLSSLSFFENNILININLPDLMAVDYWDYKSNILVYDSSIYNKQNKTWVREFSYPMKQIPTAQESFKVFIDKHFNLSQDTDSGFVTISVKHQSPHISKEWTELIVNEINSYYRYKDKIESEKSTNFLNKKIETTQLAEVKQVIAKLLQEETKKLALIEANDFYVFDYIDVPVVMEEKSEPKRAFIIILTTLLGGILGLFTVLIKNYFLKKSLY